MIGSILILIGFFLVLLSLVLLFISLNKDEIFPAICFIMALIGGIILGAIGAGLIADSPQETPIQTQEIIGETAIIREYDINENLIKEWRVVKK